MGRSPKRMNSTIQTSYEEKDVNRKVGRTVLRITGGLLTSMLGCIIGLYLFGAYYRAKRRKILYGGEYTVGESREGESLGKR